MISHIAIEFEGSPQTVVDFFKHKNLIKNYKIINPNKILIEIDQENHEEVMFFKNFVLDDFKGEKILNMTDITQEEYVKTSDGGYMLVNHGERSRPMLPTVDTADLSNRIVTQPPAEKVDFEEEKTIEELNKEQLMHKVDESISDTILPSKSHLQPNDPMNFLLEKRFLTTFFFASTALVLMLSLFD